MGKHKATKCDRDGHVWVVPLAVAHADQQHCSRWGCEATRPLVRRERLAQVLAFSKRASESAARR